MLKPLLLILAAAAVGVTSADVAAHKARMDDAQDAAFDLKDALDAKDPAKAGEADGKLTRLLDAEQAYWAKTGLEDPLSLARENGEAARAVADRVALADWPGAQAAYARMQAQCRNCHDQHPEKRVQAGG